MRWSTWNGVEPIWQAWNLTALSARNKKILILPGRNKWYKKKQSAHSKTKWARKLLVNSGLVAVVDMSWEAMIISESHSPSQPHRMCTVHGLPAICNSPSLKKMYGWPTFHSFTPTFERTFFGSGMFGYVWVLWAALCAPKHFQLQSVLLRPRLERILHSFPRAASKGGWESNPRRHFPHASNLAEIAAC